MRIVNLILLSIAAIFFVWILNEVGWDTLGHYLWQVGWYWPLLLLPYGVVNWLESWSWKYILVDPPAKTTVGRLFWLRLGGESLNQLTPTASLGGEPFKASRLQADGVPLEVASASVVIHKGILVLSLALYIFTGLALAPVFLPEAAKHMLFLCLAALGLATVGIIFVVVQRRGPCGNSFRFLSRRGWLPHFLRDQEGFLEDLDTAMSRFYRQYPSRARAGLFPVFLQLAAPFGGGLPDFLAPGPPHQLRPGGLPGCPGHALHGPGVFHPRGHGGAGGRQHSVGPGL